MRLIALIILCAVACQANSAIIGVVLTEEKTHTATCYSFNNESSELDSITCSSGSEIKNTGPFTVQSGKLANDKRMFVPATELLYQAEINGTWVILIRQEYNSFSSFKRLLSAFSGHPVQLSKIIILTIKNDGVASKVTITEKASSYHWDATAFKMEQANEHKIP